MSWSHAGIGAGRAQRVPAPAPGKAGLALAAGSPLLLNAAFHRQSAL